MANKLEGLLARQKPEIVEAARAKASEELARMRPEESRRHGGSGDATATPPSGGEPAQGR